MADPTEREVERGMAALAPFVAEWHLPLSPEELALMAWSVLQAARSSETFEEIDASVRTEITKHEEKAEALRRKMSGSDED